MVYIEEPRSLYVVIAVAFLADPPLLKALPKRGRVED